MNRRLLLIGAGLLVLAALALRARRTPDPIFPAPLAPVPPPAGESPVSTSAGTTLHGFVLDSEGRPVPGADVAFLPRKEDGRRICSKRPLGILARTDSEGRFEFPGAEEAGRLAAFRGIEGLAAGRAEGPGPHVLRFRRESRVEGLVTDEAGRPIPGAEVTARVESPEFPALVRHAGLPAPADGGGLFKLGPVAPGLSVVVEARAPGYRPEKSGPLVVIEGGVSRPVVVLRVGERIAGAVRSSDGAALDGAVVEAHQREGPVFRFLSGPEGGFSFDGLAPGPARFTVRREGYAMVTTDLEAPSEGAVLTLAPEIAVRGRVVPAVPGLQAVVTSGQASFRAVVDPDGRFRVDHVGLGRVRLDIETRENETLSTVWVDLNDRDEEILVGLR